MRKRIAVASIILRALWTFGAYAIYYEAYLDRFKHADDHFNAGRYEQAISEFKDYIALFPQNLIFPKNPKVPEALFKIGESYREMGEFDRAVEYYRELIRDYPRSQFSPRAQLQIAHINSRKLEIFTKGIDEGRDYTGALKEYQLVMRNYPNTPEARQAQIFLSAIVEKRVEQRYLTADRLYREGKKFEALEEYRAVTRNYPNSKYAILSAGFAAEINNNQYKLAQDLYLGGRFEEAINEFRIFIEHADKDDPRIASANEKIGKATDIILDLSIKARYDRAIEDFKNERYYDTVAAFNYIISTYPTSRYAEKARQEINNVWGRIIELREKEAQIVYEVAERYYATKDYQRARFKYKELIDNYPRTEHIPEAERRLQILEVLINNEEKAKELYEQGRNLMNLEEYNKAVEVFKEIIDGYFTSTSAPLARRDIVLAAKRLELRAARQYNRAYLLLQEKKYDDAIREFEVILTDYSNSDYIDKANDGIFKANVGKVQAFFEGLWAGITEALSGGAQTQGGGAMNP
ncbi:MAG: tetratricopeptide repeat protein [bacterium]